MTMTAELPCFDGRKSFNGKAKFTYDGEERIYTLISYGTIICSYNDTAKVFRRHSDLTTSATTRRHINSFLTLLNFPSFNWRNIESLPISPTFKPSRKYTIRLPQ